MTGDGPREACEARHDRDAAQTLRWAWSRAARAQRVLPHGGLTGVPARPSRNHSAVVTGVVPGDYDGDSQMDVLLTFQPKNHAGSELGAVIFWGQNQTLGEFM